MNSTIAELRWDCSSLIIAPLSSPFLQTLWRWVPRSSASAQFTVAVLPKVPDEVDASSSGAVRVQADRFEDIEYSCSTFVSCDATH